MNKKNLVLGLAVKTFTVSLIAVSMTPADLVVKSISTAEAANCSAWSPGNGKSTYYSCGGSAWRPGDGKTTYYSGGGSAWKPGSGGTTYYSKPGKPGTPKKPRGRG